MYHKLRHLHRNAGNNQLLKGPMQQTKHNPFEGLKSDELKDQHQRIFCVKPPVLQENLHNFFKISTVQVDFFLHLYECK